MSFKPQNKHSARRTAALAAAIAALAFGAGASANKGDSVQRGYAEYALRTTDVVPVSAAGAQGGVGDLAAEGIGGLYIVQLQEPPVAQYRGGRTGLAAIPRLANRGDRLDVRSPQAVNYANALKSTQTQFVHQLGQRFGAPLKQVASYQFAFNGVVVKLSPDQLQAVQRMPQVGLVEPVALLELHTDVGPGFIGAPGIWNGTDTNGAPGSRGAGMVIGVIDSGVNWANPSFADIGGDGHNHTNPLGAGNYLGLCAGQVGAGDLVNGPACNDKVIGAYANSFDFVQQVNFECANPGNPGNELGLDPTTCTSLGVPLLDLPNALDENGHGSHTASTAGGNQVDITYQNNNMTISGVAPNANLIIYDTCHTASTGQGSCFNFATLAATEQVVADGIVDAINYSIGGGTQPWTQANSLAFLAAVDAGVFVSASAGNSGPNAGTVAHLEPWVATVANGTHTRAAILPGYSVTGPGTPPANVVAQPAYLGTAGSAAVAIPSSPLKVSPDFPMVPTGTTGDGCLAYPPGTFTGAVALVRRGGCGFSIKAHSARNAGAIAILIASHPTSANPESPIAPGQTTPPGPVDVPVYGLIASQGTNLAAFAAANPTATIEIPLGGAIGATQGDVVNASSSRGPAPAFLGMIKPDIMGPGTNILAAYEGAPDSYEQLTGTSMSSPHNAGAATLVRAIRPQWSVAEVKSAMMMTSRSAGLTKQDGVTPATPFDRGAGTIDLTKAAKAGLVLNETPLRMFQADPANDGDPSLLNIASLNEAACIGTCTFTRTFRSVASTAIEYTASFANSTGVTMTVVPQTFTVNPGQPITLQITADTSASTAGTWHFGELVLTPSATNQTVITKTTTPPAPIAIPDASYTGGFAVAGQQACVNIDTTADVAPGAVVTSAELVVRATHTWVGDLTFKLRSPANTVLGLMSIPGLNETADNGTEASGRGANLAAASAITFRDGAAVSAEAMGLSMTSAQTVCALAGTPCAYVPAPGSIAQPPSLFAGFNGQQAGGVWTFCAGDSGAGDTGTVTAASLVLGSGVPAAVPTLHLPVALFAIDPLPIITVAPASLSASGVVGGPAVNAPLTIGNTGAVDLNWDSQGAIAIPGAPVYSQLMTLAENPGSGFSTGFYTGNGNNGVFLSDSFTLAQAGAIGSLYVDGFVFAASPELAYQTVTMHIYPDAGGVPAGNPQTAAAAAVWTFSGTIGSAGLSVTGGDFGGSIKLDLSAAGESLTLPAGKYWLVVAPIAGATGAPNTDEWFWLGTGATLNRDDVAMIIDPANIFGAGFTAWTPLEPILSAPNNVRFRGLSLEVTGATVCGAPWLSVVPPNGTVIPGGSQAVNVVFNPTGLAAGVYQAIVCLSSNDAATPIKSVPVTFTVTGAPTNPTATGLATPDSGEVGDQTLLTVTVTAGTNPASSGVNVVADLTSIGGAANQALLDNGTGGDAVAADGIYSYLATVGAGSAVGETDFAVTVTDAQSRTATTDIAFEVLATAEPTDPSGVGLATPDEVAAGGVTLLTVTTTAGTNPPSTDLAVTADLSAIGGSATQAFVDDGTGGDVAAGDGIFSYSATVSPATTPGAKVLTATVSDGESRSSTADIALEVTGELGEAIFSDGFEDDL